MTPQAYYRQRFRDRILEHAPDSVLDVGCGDGALLITLGEAGTKAQGVDPDADTVARAAAAGLDVRQGTAEALPFEEDSFDMVVSEFSLHHFADLPAAMAEMLRVVRRSVLLLDCWYDLSVPSQQAADAFDRWAKEIDRAAGEVHEPVLSAGEIVAAAEAAVPGVTAQTEHWLQLEPMPDDKRARIIEACLDKAPDRSAAEAALAHIRDLITAHGIAEDGALVALLTLPGAMTQQSFGA